MTHESGHIIHIDSFGNIITDVREDDLIRPADNITFEVGNRIISGLSLTYAEREGLVALIGSSSYLEIALRGGSASTLLKAEVGDEVRLRR